MCKAPNVFMKPDEYKKMWRLVQKFADLFRAKWLKCYVPSLQSRQIWHERTPNLNPGDIVLIADDNCVRGLWPLWCRTFPINSVWYVVSKYGLVQTLISMTFGSFACWRQLIS